MNGNGSMNGKAKNGIPPVCYCPQLNHEQAMPRKLRPSPRRQCSNPRPGFNQPVQEQQRNNTPAMPALSVAPLVAPLNMTSSVKPRAANISKVMPPLSLAPNLGETGTLNVTKLSGSRNRNNIMNNEQDETFEKVVVAVVRIIFGDDNLTEMNVRLVRIALERYNVHEMINSPVVV